jgi:bifunctional non-homologous end joining protein LigD
VDLIRPMLATPGPLPVTAGWAFEFKWDGVRAVTYVRNGIVEVVSRNDRSITTTYPELRAVGRLPDVVLDGEVVALDRGRPSFSKLQHRMHIARPSDEVLRRVPVAYYVFDLLWLRGESLVRVPYLERRDLLKDLGVDVPPFFTDVRGADVLESAREHGLEGVIAKRATSPYEPGKRSPAWVKVPLLQTQEVVIGGWLPGEGRRAGTIGSLLLGVPSDDGLRYVGKVGTGFTDPMLRRLHRTLTRRASSPFIEVPALHARGVQWVEPEWVGEVEYRAWTPEGRLRHSSWRGLRPDKI